jgi:hypothetical protein
MPSRSHSGVVQVGQVKQINRTRLAMIVGLPAVSLLLPAIAEEIAAAGGTSEVTRIAAAITKFLLFYSGVFALIGLTAAVGVGVLATDRIVMTPRDRILAQALHRTTSLLAVAALANHIMLEVMAQRVHLVDGFVPFMSSDRTFFMGLGTLASDLFLLIIITGLLRGRFTTGTRPRLWRLLHAGAYACWPLAILHGLLAGRPAKPYVDWSYGGLLALVGLALALRRIMVMRERTAAPTAADLARTPLAPRAPRAEVLGQIGGAPATALLPAGLPMQVPVRPAFGGEPPALPPGHYPPPRRYADDRYQPGPPQYGQYPDDGYGPGSYGPGSYDDGEYDGEYDGEPPGPPGIWPLPDAWAPAGPFEGQDR